jgi:predicted permease
MTLLLHDLRYALRVLIRDRWMTLAAVVALALGIGVTNTVFTLVNTVILREMPFDDPDRVMWLGTRDARGREVGVSRLDFFDWRAASRSFSGMSYISGGPLNLSDDVRVPEQVAGVYLNAAAFPIIGERNPTKIGRVFTDDDDREGAPIVFLISDNLWKSRYNADPSVIGRTIRVSGLTGTVIGVMREGMRFPYNNDLWVPLAHASLQRTEGRGIRTRPAIARLADGVTIAQARAEMESIGAQLARDYPESNKDAVPTVGLYAERLIGPQIRTIFWSLMGAVTFVLLIACANVANLLLARAAHRGREVSVRVSLGATRGRIVRQLLVESVLLSLAGGVVGLGVSVLGVRWFDSALGNVGRPYWMEFTMDAQVFAFFAAVCLLTGIVFGLAPALHISKTSVTDVLKEGGRTGSGGLRSRRWMAGLIVGELTLTLVLLAGSGLLIRSFLKLYAVDLGVDTSQMLTMQLRMPPRQYPAVEGRIEFLRRVDERLASNAAFQTASTASNLPLFFGLPRQLTLDGRPAALEGDVLPTVTLLSVGPRYFDVLGLRALRGRVLTSSDGGPGQENVVINQRFAALHFPTGDPLGQRIRLTEAAPPNATPPPGAEPPGWLTIVGVTPTIRQSSFQQPEPDAVAYVPHRGNPAVGFDAVLMVRAPSDPANVAALLREEIRAIDPDMPLFNIRSLDEALAQLRWSSRTFGTMFTVFALIALVLSAVGLYAVTAYSVTQRTQEIGVRMALGAEPSQVSWLVLRRGLAQVAAGVVLGLAGALGVGRLLRGLLVQTTPNDPMTLVGIVVVLVTVAVVACVWPARRATRVDPLTALRCE